MRTPLTMTLRRSAADRAEGLHDDDALAIFEPQALFADQPLHPDVSTPCRPGGL